MKNKKQIRVFSLLFLISFVTVLGAIKGINSVRNRDESIISGTFVMPKNVVRAKPVGRVTGIYAKMRGVLVLENAQLHDDENNQTCPSEGKLLEGDYIVRCGKKEIVSKEELKREITNSKGNAVVLTIIRNGKKIKQTIKPIKHDGEYKIGAWVRDDLAGLGTITMVTEDGVFAALGHCMSDIDLGKEISISYGSLHDCHITDIRKGQKQKPGALIGYIEYNPNQPIGNLEKNSPCGILGTINRLPKEIREEKYYPLANEKEICDGEAVLISNVSGKRKSYKIMIKKLSWLVKTESKDFEIKVWDEDLIELTGGIVQGMSGSPIIQNGRIIGAVTHVLVNDPTRGYGIFIENMLKN